MAPRITIPVPPPDEVDLALPYAPPWMRDVARNILARRRRAAEQRQASQGQPPTR